MRKESDESPHRVVRDLLERVTVPLVTDPTLRAQNQVMRAVRELELMGLSQDTDGDLDFVHLEYDKFRSKVRSQS